MNKLLFGLATAGAVVAMPAVARDGQVYVGLEGGVVSPEDFNFRLQGPDSLVFPNSSGNAPTIAAQPADTG